MGGEEFAVALHDTDTVGASKAAEKLRAAEALYAAKGSGRNRIAVASGAPGQAAESAKAPTPISHAARSAERRLAAERNSS